MTNIAGGIAPASQTKDAGTTAATLKRGGAFLAEQFDRNARALTDVGALLQKNAKLAVAAGGVATRSAQLIVQKTTDDSRKLLDSAVEGVGRTFEAKTPEQLFDAQQKLFSAYAAVVTSNLTTVGDLVRKTSQDLIAHWSDPLFATVEHFQKAGARA